MNANADMLGKENKMSRDEKPGFPATLQSLHSACSIELVLRLVIVSCNVDCTPDNGQIVKQWYLRQPPLRTEPEICN